MTLYLSLQKLKLKIVFQVHLSICDILLILKSSTTDIIIKIVLIIPALNIVLIIHLTFPPPPPPPHEKVLKNIATSSIRSLIYDFAHRGNELYHLSKERIVLYNRIFNITEFVMVPKKISDLDFKIRFYS